MPLRTTASLNISTDTVIWSPRPRDNMVGPGDQIIFETTADQLVIVFQGETPFDKPNVAGPPFVYVSTKGTPLILTIRRNIPDLPRSFPFRCGLVSGGVLRGLENAGDEVKV